MKKPYRVLKPIPPLFPGETAGYTDAEAAILLAKGAIEPIHKEVEPFTRDIPKPPVDRMIAKKKSDDRPDKNFSKDK